MLMVTVLSAATACYRRIASGRVDSRSEQRRGKCGAVCELIAMMHKLLKECFFDSTSVDRTDVADTKNATVSLLKDDGVKCRSTVAENVRVTQSQIGQWDGRAD